MIRTIWTGCLVVGLTLPAWAGEPQPKLPTAPSKEAQPKEPAPVPAPVPGKEAEPKEKEPEPEETPPAVTRPPLELVLLPGAAHAVPLRKGVAYANGGIIDVAQPNPTTIVVTMTGLTATNADLICKSLANYSFDLEQCFGICFNTKRVKSAKLTLEGQVIGLLRTDHRLYTCCLGKCCCGTAETNPATAAVTCGDTTLVGMTLPARAAAGCNDLSVYNHEGPLCVPVLPGKFTLHASWGFGTTHPAFFCRGASAEFSPEPHYCTEGSDAYWFAHFHPFNGVATRDFGYRLTIKLIAE
jgi:hypothetical protein